jgi:hypothetical protein
MPSLDRQPNDGLADRIARIERQLREVRTVRRVPATGVSVSSPYGVSLTSGVPTAVTFYAGGFSTSQHFIDVPSTTFTIPVDGMYLIVAALGPRTSGGATAVTLSITNADEYLNQAGPVSSASVARITTVAAFEAEDTTGLVATSSGDGTFTGADFMIYRISDLYPQ